MGMNEKEFWRLLKDENEKGKEIPTERVDLSNDMSGFGDEIEKPALDRVRNKNVGEIMALINGKVVIIEVRKKI